MGGYYQILQAMVDVPRYLASRSADLQSRGNDILEQKVLKPLLDISESRGESFFKTRPEDLSFKLVKYLSLLGTHRYQDASEYALQLTPDIMKAYQN